MQADLEVLVRSLYEALTTGDADTIDRLLAPGFVGDVAEGMPLDLGGRRDGPADMRDRTWWAIGRDYKAFPEAEEWIPCADGRLLVLGTYRGKARGSGNALEAPFAHLWTGADGQITRLRHYTDTARWAEALG